MTQSHRMPPSGGMGKPRRAGPIFTDPTGQRRRLMRVLGAGASVLLVGALILVGIGLFGGPDTPFSVFSAPIADRDGQQGTSGHDGQADHSVGPAQPGTSGGVPQPGSSTSRPRSPRPSSSAGPSSPAETNRAGKTPPGQRRSKRPHPSPSPSSHAR